MSKHLKKDYILVDENASGHAPEKAKSKGAHARIVLPDVEEIEDDQVFDREPEAEQEPELDFAPEEAQEDAVEEDFSEVQDYDAADSFDDEAFDQEEHFADEEEPKAPKSHKGLKIAGIVAGAVVGVVAVAYVAGALFFGSHFLPNTVINGVDVSLKAPEEVHDQLAATLEDYKLEVTGPDYALTIEGDDIAYGLDPHHDMLANFNQWAWPIDIATGASSRADFGVSYDKDALSQILKESLDTHNEEASAPKDAHLSYDEKTDNIVVAPEVQGTKLDFSKVTHSVENALGLASSKLELGKDDLVAPQVLAGDENLKKAAQQVNQLSPVNVTMMLGQYPALKINKGSLLNWIAYDDNHNVRLNEGAVEEWAKQTASKLNTYGTEHTYVRPDGKEVTVTGETAFGWSFDVDALSKSIVDAIHEGSKGEIAIPCDHEGAYYNMETGAEWSRFVDVDLDEQHAYFFDEKGEVIWESDIISGNINYPSRWTPTGVFSIQRKATNERLSTYNEGDEEPTISYVAYWMPFIGNMYALHDAWWQPGFGGTMYRDGYGSHGCVNLPTDAAAEIYDIIEIGDVVVVHW